MDGHMARRGLLRFGAAAAAGIGGTVYAIANANPVKAAGNSVAIAAPETTLSYVPVSAQDAALPSVPARVRTTLVQGTQAGHLWRDGTSQGGATTLDDENEYMVGSQSARRVSDGSAGMSRLQVVGGAPVDFSDKHVSVMLRLEGLANIKWLTVFAASGNLSGVHYKWDLKPPAGVGWFLADGRWSSITLNFADAVKVGAPNITALTDWRVMAVDDNTGRPVVLNVGKIDSVPRTNRWPNGVWTLSLDDSIASQMGIIRYASQYGIRGTLYTIAELIDQDGFLTTTQLRSAQDDLGWEVGAHAMTLSAHNNTFPSLSPDQLETELTALKMWLRIRGFTAANHMAYPKGVFNGPVLDSVKRHFPGSARGTFSGATDTAPPPERHMIRARALGSSRTLEQAKADIDSAYSSKGWIHHYGHRFDQAASDTGWAISNMRTLIEYATAKGIGIATVGEVLSAQYA